MPDRLAVERGGYKCLLGETIRDLTASAAIFDNAPAGTAFILLTIRTAGLTMRGDGVAATTSAGIDYAVGTYELEIGRDQARDMRAIENGGNTAGWIEYWGLA